MNILRTSFLFIPTFFFLVFFAISRSASADQITLASDPWCPKICFDAKDKPGYVVEAARSALSRHGYELRVVELPWSRAIQSVKNGTIDGLLTDPTGDTDSVILPEHAYFSSIAGYAIHNRVSHSKELSDSDLRKIRFKLIQDYDYSLIPAFSKIVSNQDDVFYIKGNNALSRILKIISSGRADATIDDIEILKYNIDQLNLNDDFHLSPISEPIKIYISISKRRPDAAKIATILSDEIHAMKHDGRIDMLISKYYITAKQVAE